MIYSKILTQTIWKVQRLIIILVSYFRIFENEEIIITQIYKKKKSSTFKTLQSNTS